MTQERLRAVLSNVLGWGSEHDTEFMQCMIDAMELTQDEIRELNLEEYLEADDEDDDYEEIKKEVE